jgi:hypothetical protein
VEDEPRIERDRIDLMLMSLMRIETMLNRLLDEGENGEEEEDDA